jgi:hypothetical protein
MQYQLNSAHPDAQARSRQLAELARHWAQQPALDLRQRPAAAANHHTAENDDSDSAPA